MSAVTLFYKRFGPETFNGEVVISEAGSVAPLPGFQGINFLEMMKLFSKALSENPGSSAFIQRTDRPGLMPFALPPEQVISLINDPEGEVERLSFPAQRVVIKESPPPPEEPLENAVLPLEAGYDSLANCFGHQVFAKARKAEGTDQIEAECPACGDWAILKFSTEGVHCPCECGITSRVDLVPEDPSWAGFKVTDLLLTGCERFFLPRRWNNYKNWISSKDLQSRYSEFVKEMDKS